MTSVLLTIFVFLICASAVCSDQFCNERKSYFETLTTHRTDFQEGIEAIIGANQVTFFGESHDNDGWINYLYPNLLKSLRNSNIKIDCLFLEGDRRGQWAINKFMTFKDRGESIRNLNDHPGMIDPRFKGENSFQPLAAAANSNLLKIARALHIKVFAIDKAFDPDDVYNPLTPESMQSRNQQMANRIKQLFGSNTCKKAVMSVGAII